MSDTVLETILLTLRVATVATVALVVPGLSIAYLLARRDFVGKTFLAAVTGMPLLIPPTVVGVLLLHLFATDGPLGARALGVDLDLVLSWKGAAVASAVMSLPLVVRTARIAFEEVDPRLEQMARTLGHGPVATFFRYTVPMARRGLLASLLLGYTRALGEYGATVTLAGSIPGETRTLASAITTADQAGDVGETRLLLGVALALGFAAVFVAERLAETGASRRSPRA